MSPENSQEPVREPKPSRLLLIGVCVLLAAGGVVVNGVRVRAKAEQDLPG